mmetsp:Transcript_24390/g.44173  ORF Transcript_24390/g.44173 Transcript_24390/m.44173 type:complete len:160 (+) Transcript_24390:49-528(+)
MASLLVAARVVLYSILLVASQDASSPSSTKMASVRNVSYDPLATALKFSRPDANASKNASLRGGGEAAPDHYLNCADDCNYHNFANWFCDIECYCSNDVFQNPWPDTEIGCSFHQANRDCLSECGFRNFPYSDCFGHGHGQCTCDYVIPQFFNMGWTCR